MGKNTINKQLMRFVKGACGGASGNASCNRTAMYGAISKPSCPSGQSWHCAGPQSLLLDCYCAPSTQ
jgi:hypothetical protein